MKVIGIYCVCSFSLIEIPYSEKFEGVVGDKVIFKTEDEKEEFGIIRYVNQETQKKEKVLKESKVLRKATANDTQKVERAMEASVESLEPCRKLVEKFGLDMHIFKAGFSFDAKKAYFMFISDDRVDFREFVKELALVLKKQIHLRQVGPRDRARLTSGFGKCGRPLCCSAWLGSLTSINMDMVRAQALESKGSSKLSGACGKLLCCLKYEVEAYKALKESLPKINTAVSLKSDSRDFSVVGLDVLNQKVKIAIYGEEPKIVELEEIIRSRTSNKPN